MLHAGNTPTCVGKTAMLTGRQLMGRKHPHVRGEDEEILNLADGKQETPPRAWGRPTGRTSPMRCEGNTPTCVGKTSTPATAAHLAQKHPHVRGEDPWRYVSSTYHPETPPRAWGRLTSPESIRKSFRNTPTCVGKTRTHSEGLTSCRKHPHVRGEDFRPTPLTLLHSETPPRAWGRHQYIVKER